MALNGKLKGDGGSERQNWENMAALKADLRENDEGRNMP